MPESRLPEGCRAAFRFTGELLLGYLRTAAILRCEPLLSCDRPEVPDFSLTLLTE